MKYSDVHGDLESLQEFLSDPMSEELKASSYVVRYPEDDDEAYGEIGIREFGGWCSSGITVRLSQMELLKQLEAVGVEEYGVEDCHGEQWWLSCGCYDHNSWAHMAESFPGSTGCPTCDGPGQRGPTNFTEYLCEKHGEEREREEEREWEIRSKAEEETSKWCYQRYTTIIRKLLNSREGQMAFDKVFPSSGKRRDTLVTIIERKGGELEIDDRYVCGLEEDIAKVSLALRLLDGRIEGSEKERLWAEQILELPLFDLKEINYTTQ